MVEKKTPRELSRRHMFRGLAEKVKLSEAVAAVAAAVSDAPAAPVKSGPDPRELAPVLESACTALQNNDLKAAIESLRTYVKAFPQDLASRLNLGWSLYRDSQYIQARVEFERALSMAPNPFASLYLGLSLLRAGKTAKAAAAWQALAGTPAAAGTPATGTPEAPGKDSLAAAILGRLEQLAPADSLPEPEALALAARIAGDAETLAETFDLAPPDIPVARA